MNEDQVGKQTRHTFEITKQNGSCGCEDNAFHIQMHSLLGDVQNSVLLSACFGHCVRKRLRALCPAKLP